MRKLLFSLFMLVISMAFVSCGTQFGLVYGVQLTGDGDGQFEVTFPQGSYAMNGKAALALNVGDSIMFNDVKVTTKNEVIERANKKQLRAMQQVNDSVAAYFNAVSGDGTYDLWLKGFVKEVGTGLVFSVDKHITNRDAALRKSVDADVFCPYIK